LVLVVIVGVVVFWPGRGSQPVEVVAAKPDTQPKRAATARPSIRDIERIRAPAQTDDSLPTIGETHFSVVSWPAS